MIEERRKKVFNLFIEGKDIYDILEETKKEYPKTTIKTIINDINRKIKRFKLTRIVDKNTEKLIQIQQFEHLLASVMSKVKDNIYAVDRAITILKELQKLRGLDKEEPFDGANEFEIVIEWPKVTIDDD